MGLEKGQQGMGDFMDGGVEDGLKGEGAAKPRHLGCGIVLLSRSRAGGIKVMA